MNGDEDEDRTEGRMCRERGDEGRRGGGSDGTTQRRRAGCGGDADARPQWEAGVDGKRGVGGHEEVRAARAKWDVKREDGTVKGHMDSPHRLHLLVRHAHKRPPPNAGPRRPLPRLARHHAAQVRRQLRGRPPLRLPPRRRRARPPARAAVVGVRLAAPAARQALRPTPAHVALAAPASGQRGTEWGCSGAARRARPQPEVERARTAVEVVLMG
ncbi:hypothetical protein DFH09DRAFT_1281679 [Mycena vulgaris]|nr:hypothetical protein DFH09DRAFT_1281679 [Mycena vulgaris]